MCQLDRSPGNAQIRKKIRALSENRGSDAAARTCAEPNCTIFRHPETGLDLFSAFAYSAAATSNLEATQTPVQLHICDGRMGQML
jgi:hypothetical protein